MDQKLNFSQDERQTDGKLSEIKSEVFYNPKNSGHQDSYEVGNKFQDFVCVELAKQGIILQNINSKKFQMKFGENLQGFEIKYDARCTGDNRTLPTGRLSIEIAEKTNANNINWIASGIYRNDGSWLYIHGNYMMFWIFSTKLLRELHKTNRYKEGQEPTIKKFYLSLNDADRYCAKKIVL